MSREKYAKTGRLPGNKIAHVLQQYLLLLIVMNV